MLIVISSGSGGAGDPQATKINPMAANSINQLIFFILSSYSYINEFWLNV